MNNASEVSDSSDHWCDLPLDDDDLQNILDAPLPSQSKSQLRTGEQHAGFDNNVGETWLYPTNLPQRSYQLSIIEQSLFNNTLVVLPTGLGKTFIAAVVMYNIYRWYPSSKIIFMAPTRPLVAQQIEACQRVMPFPDEDTIELTGRLQRNRRTELWNKKRVFFVTPQVVQSDIIGGDEATTSKMDINFPFKDVKLIVVDEAHRAKGRYAYTEVVQMIKRHNNYFRVLALSATPGRTMEDIAEVVRNLLISHIEVRSDTSVDVMPYVHKRHMKTVVVPLSEDLKELHAEILEIIDPYLRQLIDANVLSGSLAKISRNFLLYEQKRFRDRSQNQPHQNQGAISTNFSFCISMYHALELLERHGMRVFQNYFEDDEDGRSKFVVNIEPRLRRLLDRLRDQLGPNPYDISTHPMTNGQIARVPLNLDFGHPKFDEARKCLLEHFQAKPDSRAIVFCEYRESVMLIFRLLLQHVPLLKPRYFVGQGGSNGSLRPLTQKEQIQIMKDFRSGKNNILVATSIGEEGIDVGEVELIVCFDINTSNPRRFIQRIGRTGRQKQGNVVVLVTKGREEQLLKEVLSQKDQTNAKIQSSMIVRQSLYKYSPRLVPTELNPKVVHIFIKPTSHDNKKVVNNTSDKDSKTKNAQKKSKGKEVKTSQDLRTFFKKKTPSKPVPVLDDPSQHGLETQENIDKCLSNIDDYFKAFEVPVKTNTQLLESNKSSQPLPQTSNESTQKSLLDSERFRNLKKLIEKNTPLIPAKELITDPIEQLKSSKVSDDGKRFILRSKPSIVREVLEKFKILEILPIEPSEMSEEEKNVRDLYGIIEKLLGGSRLNVEMFLDDAEIDDMAKGPSEVSDIDDMSDSEYNKACDAIFEGLDEQGILCDNYDYIQEEFKKTEYYKELHENSEKNQLSTILCTPKKNVAESMIYETVILDEDVESNSITDTSMSTETITQHQCQWDEFAKNAPLANKSTPLLGPLAKAFQRQHTKFNKRNLKTGGISLKRLAERFDKSKQDEEDELEVICLSETESTSNIVGSLNDLDLKKQDILTKNCSTAATSKEESSSTNILNELDVDMEAFLEPFPEESNLEKATETTISVLSGNSTTSLGSSQKENKNTSNLITPNKSIPHTTTTSNADDDSIVLRANRPVTPPTKLPAETEQYSKSPSLYEMYLKNVRKRSKLPEHIKQSVSFAENQVLKALSSSITNETNTNTNTISTTNIYEDEKSVIIPSKTLKRKIISSSDSSEMEMKAADAGSETECEEFVETQINMECMDTSTTAMDSVNITKNAIKENSQCDSSVIDSHALGGSETECDEIAESQKPKRPLRLHRQRLRRLHHFIDGEAKVSGDDGSDDEETEMPFSQYVKDSMVVSSDEADTSDENAPTPTQMQAHYLQTVKSPALMPRGAFKIPAPREFNDRTKIYSQTVPIAESQYVCDSFVVHEEDVRETTKLQNETMCPLERAERILKERRRARRKFKAVAKVQRRRRIYQPTESSDDEN